MCQSHCIIWAGPDVKSWEFQRELKRQDKLATYSPLKILLRYCIAKEIWILYRIVTISKVLIPNIKHALFCMCRA